MRRVLRRFVKITKSRECQGFKETNMIGLLRLRTRCVQNCQACGVAVGSVATRILFRAIVTTLNNDDQSYGGYLSANLWFFVPTEMAYDSIRSGEQAVVCLH